MKWGPWVLEVLICDIYSRWIIDAQLQTTGGAGFRLDAVKHMDRQFLADWVRSISFTLCDSSYPGLQLRHTRATIGKPDAFAVAEYWESS